MAKKSLYRVLTDDELFVMLKTDKFAEAEFYRRYKIRVKGFLKSYHLNALEREDLIQEGMIGLFQAIETYDETKGAKFSTYSNICMRNRIYNSLSSLWRHKKKIDNRQEMEELVVNRNPESDTLSMELTDSLKRIMSNLKELERNILERYLRDESYKTIASELGITTKKVDNVLMKIKNKIAAINEMDNDEQNKKKKKEEEL